MFCYLSLSTSHNGIAAVTCSFIVLSCIWSIQPCIGVRRSSSALLYVINSPVGPYFSQGTFVPVKLYANPAYIRAWEGGVGESKMGG